MHRAPRKNKTQGVHESGPYNQNLVIEASAELNASDFLQRGRVAIELGGRLAVD